MRKSTLATILFLLVVCSCSNDKTYPSTFKMRVGQTVLIGSGVSLTMDSISDSRCPSNVDCIWQGVAIVQFTIHQQTEVTHFALNTIVDDAYSGGKPVAGYVFMLLQLSPYPVNGVFLKPGDYEADVRVWKQ